MSLQLRWTEQAVDQLGAIADYLSQTSPVYAEGLVTRVATQLQRLLEFPEIGRVVPEAESPQVRGHRMAVPHHLPSSDRNARGDRDRARPP